MPENNSNRSSTGSNIIPPPHDFESDTEQDEILCIESGSKIEHTYNPKKTKDRVIKVHDNTSMSMKSNERTVDTRPKPPKR